MTASQPSSPVSVTVEGDVALVRLERPERRNALNAAAAGSVKDAIEDASSRARVIILTGAGRAFCDGQDLRERLEP
ncbi:MAG: enoyl-CoA hydratase-related protein, partial [Actinomycetota bacterium]